MDLKILSLTSSAKLAQIGECIRREHKGFQVLSLLEVTIFTEFNLPNHYVRL